MGRKGVQQTTDRYPAAFWCLYPTLPVANVDHVPILYVDVSESGYMI